MDLKLSGDLGSVKAKMRMRPHRRPLSQFKEAPAQPVRRKFLVSKITSGSRYDGPDACTRSVPLPARDGQVVEVDDRRSRCAGAAVDLEIRQQRRSPAKGKG